MPGDHVAIFPFMAKGHTIPLLDLAGVIAAAGARVTIITTAGNAVFVRRSLPSDENPNVHLALLPFPSSPTIPEGCESTDQLPSFDLFPAFFGATTLLRDPFHRLLHQLCRSSPPPLCLISDFFLGWTLPVCRSLGVPRMVFHGMGVFSMALCKSLCLHLPKHLAAGSGEPFHVPGTPSHLRLTLADVPDVVRNFADPNDPSTRFLMETGESDVSSWGIIVNSFAQLEPDYVTPLESFYSDGARAWLVGPLCLLPTKRERDVKGRSECMEWLDGQERGSVVYVSFGTQAHVSDEQLDEVAHGLAASGCQFLWVVRSAKWVPPEGVEMQGRGRIERGWVPQREVLEHAAVGGFVSHCGWNSVLESAAAGVPILTWPMIAEQALNAKLVAEELGMGLALKMGGDDNNKLMVGRREVSEGVRELMMEGGEKGRKAREQAKELQRAAMAAVGDGGSSRRTLDKLMEELRQLQRSKGVTVSLSDVTVSLSDEGFELDGAVVDSDPNMQLDWQQEIQTA